MLSKSALEAAICSITNQIVTGGMFIIASIRDYDTLLIDKPPYIHKTNDGQRVSFQTWNWDEDHYSLTQYIIDDAKTLQISKFDCAYSATHREELTNLLISNGSSEVKWLFLERNGFLSADRSCKEIKIE